MSATGMAAIMMVAGSASAQTKDSSSEVDAVVVTGSLIRGVAPVGTNVSAVSTADIQRTGAISTNQILTSIPQLTNAFNVIPVTPSGVGRSTFRPDLRSLGNVGHATTLVLIDGHNAVGSGILQTTPDIGMIPPGAIERVEVVADGGSSIYGSDAVGGILNFITRTRFQGLEAKGNAGFADHYHAYNVSVTAGTDFKNGSALISFYNRANTSLLNQYRERPRQNLIPLGGSDFRGRNCAPGNVTASGTVYALPSFTPGLNLCDTTALGNLAPSEGQNAIFASVTYHLASNLDFEMKAFGSDRATTQLAAQRTTGSATINNTNPFFHQIGTETSQTVAFSYAPALGIRAESHSALKAYHATPTLTWHMDHGWRTRFMYDFGWSETTAATPTVNSNLEAAALRGVGLTTATALNPYDPSQTNANVIQGITNWYDQSRARQKMSTFRVIADGNLFTLPGGDVRGAFGAQDQYTDIRGYEFVAPYGQIQGSTNGNDVFASRRVDGFFGEVLVPLVGAANAMPFMRSFEIDFSARHDRYNDVGNTTNPKIGATWDVVEGVRLRGNYGTSFTAPSLADTAGAVNKSIAIFATSTVRPGDNPNFRLRPEVRIQGGTPGLAPMPAITWSVGGDFAPKQIEGLRVALTYWSIDMDKRVGLIPTANTDLYTVPGYSPYYILNPTKEQAVALTSAAGGFLTGGTSVAALYGVGNDPYILTDARRKNLGRLQTSGVDYSVNYRRPMDFGALYAGASGVLRLTQRSKAAPGAPWVDQAIQNLSKFNSQIIFGADVGKYTATATINYTDGYRVDGIVGQTRVGAFAPLNLFFRYDAGHDLMVTLNIDNALDAKTPFENINGGFPQSAGFLLTSTLGRYVSVGVSKKF